MVTCSLLYLAVLLASVVKPYREDIVIGIECMFCFLEARRMLGLNA